MTDLNERIENLEEIIDELSIDLHASKVAITVLSTVINRMSNEPGLLAKSFIEARKVAPPVVFDKPVQEGYEELLTEKILSLLSRTESPN
ncbi:hypothetical protein JGS89_000130 [Salmonella enterica]|nr:hypothetical protein [Salmonella enterica subsp. enterica serovar Kinshasa]EEE0519996.1 hypothetical protein [Salmonella enterica subsp. enterica serovar Uganda]EEG1746428.1 hypothetical protein [Salmonella enterica subsp. enterica]EGM6075047.1 hypothetical protein [Salmonella enterica]EEK2872246.1 hypothetical protein [Salmonella enterica subsp. enterica]